MGGDKVVLLQMVSGGIENIYSDRDSTPGCESCDFGSCYTNEYTIEMTTGKIEIKVEQMYEHLLSDGYMMELILPNTEEIKKMTENEFFEWVKDKFDERIWNESSANNYCDLKGSVEFIQYE